MKILGIESSCDETAAAVVEDGRNILSNVVNSQIALHATYGGVVPEIASRAHTENICEVTRKALSDAHLSLSDLDAVAVTNRPGLLGALLVGVNFAKTLAFANHLPLCDVNHLRGHIAAAYLTDPALKPPFHALVVSGGHTFLCEVREETEFSLLGQTRDDAAGEAFDKVARVLSLPYPGGRALQELADSFSGEELYALPPPVLQDAPLDFSFSGLKTAVINLAHRQTQAGEPLSRARLAASFSKAVCVGVLNRLENLCACQKVEKLVLAGGVASNTALRERIGAFCAERGIYYLPVNPALCGDNAAMIASQGFFELRAGRRAPTSLNALARADLD